MKAAKRLAVLIFAVMAVMMTVSCTRKCDECGTQVTEGKMVDGRFVCEECEQTPAEILTAMLKSMTKKQ